MSHVVPAASAIPDFPPDAQPELLDSGANHSVVTASYPVDDEMPSDVPINVGGGNVMRATSIVSVTWSVAIGTDTTWPLLNRRALRCPTSNAPLSSNLPVTFAPSLGSASSS